MHYDFAFQRKEQEYREEKLSQLDNRHNFVLENVATRLDLPFDEVVESILNGDQVKFHELFALNDVSGDFYTFSQIEMMTKFFQPGGSKLMFFYDPNVPESKEDFGEG